MARPTSRKGSSVRQFKQRIPADVRPKAVGSTLSVPVGDQQTTFQITASTEAIQFSLRTRDPAEAKLRHVVALAHVEAHWKAMREGPVRLQQRDIVALSGEIYRDLVGPIQADPGPPDRWEWFQAVVEHHFDSLVAPGPDDDRLTIIDRVLARHALVIDQNSKDRLIEELRRVLSEAAARLKANAEGDYVRDTNLDRFPAVEITQHKSPGPLTDQPTLTDLMDGWWRENERAGAKRRTYEGYRNTMRAFVRFLGHDDARRVSPEDVIRFKDYRLSQPSPRTGESVSARTVKDSDLAGLKSVFNWAVANRKVPTNPAQGVTIKLHKPAKLREKGFLEDEATALLAASSRLRKSDGELPQTFALKRWVPWVLAYTGARVSEIVQLRRQDVRRTGDHWSLLITPEAGSVKDNEARQVPLHPHLVELGFVEFVSGASDGYLFVRPHHDTGDVHGPIRGAVNRLREFARLYVTDPNVKPNHGWRHLFVTRSRRFGLDLELRRMITGHAGEHVDEREYGDPAGLYRELCKLPRFEIGEKQGLAPEPYAEKSNPEGNP